MSVIAKLTTSVEETNILRYKTHNYCITTQKCSNKSQNALNRNNYMNKILEKYQICNLGKKGEERKLT